MRDEGRGDARRIAPVEAGDRGGRTALGGMRRFGGGALIAALLAGIAVALFVYAPPLISLRVVQAIRADSTGPVLERVIAALPGETARLFEVPPDAAVMAQLMTSADVLNHRGLALLHPDGSLIWQSEDFDVGDIGAPLASAFAGGHLALVHVETGLDHGPDGLAYVKEHLTSILYPVLRDGRPAGALMIRFDDWELETVVGRMTRVLIAAFLGAAALSFGSLIYLASRAQRERAAAERQVLLARNTSMVEQLRLGREMSLLAELNEWLQSSRDLDELFGMVVRFLDVLLPGSSGSIYIYSNSRDVLDGAVSWGGAAHRAHIHPQDSWALRRGRSYEFGETAVAFACGYVTEPEPKPYLSIPFLAHGETVGLMHINYPDGKTEAERSRLRRMAQTCAEQISLAIANVRMRDELRSQAVRDPLTSLYNRRYMMDRMRSLTERRGAPGFALVSIDIDRFKIFNDNHGHDAGDAVIRAVGEAMVGQLVPRAFACRSGGEELAVVMPEADLAAGLALAEALRARIETTQVLHNGTVLPTVTISIGVSAFPQHGSTLPEIIQRADAALYTAKHRGRNRVVGADDAEMGILSGGGAAAALPMPETGPAQEQAPHAIAAE